jgi:hypothetical protein
MIKSMFKSLTSRITLATLALTLALASVASAQIISGCEDRIVFQTGDNARVCYISHADAEWCYYTCGGAS